MHTRTFPACLAAVLLLVPACLAAAAEPEKADAKKEADAPIPAELVDADFAGKVDLALVRAAIAELSAARLIAQAGIVARAEKELGRAHKGVPAKALFALSLRVIDEQRDKAALAALGALLADLGIKDYDAKIAALKPLLDQPRRIDPGPNVPLSETTKEGILLYAAYKNQIKLARVIGDRSGLDSIRKNVQLADELHAKQRQHLVSLLGEAVASLPPAPAADSVALAKLTANLYVSM